MQIVSDIREYKKNLRQRYRNERTKLSAEKKMRLDDDIAQKFYRLNQYNNAKLVLIYVSTPIEIDTINIIERAWQDGKDVAVPRCVEGTRKMEFYRITDLSQLSRGSFGVLEPSAVDENKVCDFSDSICVVPAFCFDEQGYRLGYGKGYYDRFLSKYSGVKVGICYSTGVRYHLLHGHFDCPVDFLVTERYIKTTALSKRKKRRFVE